MRPGDRVEYTGTPNPLRHTFGRITDAVSCMPGMESVEWDEGGRTLVTRSLITKVEEPVV